MQPCGKRMWNQRLQLQFLSSWWWAVCRPKHVEQLRNFGIINSTLLHSILLQGCILLVLLMRGLTVLSSHVSTGVRSGFLPLVFFRPKYFSAFMISPTRATLFVHVITSVETMLPKAWHRRAWNVYMQGNFHIPCSFKIRHVISNLAQFASRTWTKGADM
jgi:hypothetical protein